MHAAGLARFATTTSVGGGAIPRFSVYVQNILYDAAKTWYGIVLR